MNASSAKQRAATRQNSAASRSNSKGRTTRSSSIVPAPQPSVKAPAAEGAAEPAKPARGRPKRSRRQGHGSAWHWKQTDCWYYTLAGTKQRVPLCDEEGRRIRGLGNKQAAQLALARVKLGGDFQVTPEQPPQPEEWLVAKVCSEYIQYCERKLARGALSRGHRDMAHSYLNDFCKFCGALPVAQLKKGHVRTWIEGHAGWKSPATHRNAITLVLAAFNLAQENHDLPNPVKGLKKPTAQPRLHSLSHEDEQAMYAAADEVFRDFLFAAMHTGLRPYCELAKLTADEVEETPRGMMWRVYSSKTKKTRKIPVQAAVAELTRRLMQTSPRGSGQPLFRNSRGGQWQKIAGVHRFIQLRRKLGWDKDQLRKRYSSYSCRHTFAHRMLSGYWNGGQGCSIETLAELIGDTPKVASIITAGNGGSITKSRCGRRSACRQLALPASSRLSRTSAGRRRKRAKPRGPNGGPSESVRQAGF